MPAVRKSLHEAKEVSAREIASEEVTQILAAIYTDWNVDRLGKVV